MSKKWTPVAFVLGAALALALPTVAQMEKLGSSSGTTELADDTTPQLGGDLDAQGNNITDLAHVTFQTGATGGTLRTGTSNADKFILQGYDVNDSVYRDVIELDAGNDVVLQIIADYLAIEDATDTTKHVEWDLSGATGSTTTTLAFSQTAGRTITFPDATTTLMGSPGSSTDNALPRFDGTGGSALQDSFIEQADSGLVTVTHQTDAASVDVLNLVGPDRGTVLDNDEIKLNFQQEDAGGSPVTGARLTSVLSNTGAGGEDFELYIGTRTNSTLDEDFIKIGNGWMMRSGTNNNPALLGNGNSGSTTANYTFQGDTNTGIGRASDDQLSLIAGGVEGLRITEDGSGAYWIIDTRSAAPSTPAAGWIYYDTDSNELCVYNGSAWTGLIGGGVCS